MIGSETERQVRHRLEAMAGSLKGPGLPEPARVRELLAELDRGLGEIGEVARVRPHLAPLVRLAVVQGAFPVLLAYAQGDPRLAWHLLTQEWSRVVFALGARGWDSELREPDFYYGDPLGLADPAAAQELLGIFNLAVFELLRAAKVQEEGRQTARRLMSHLALSYDQLGRAFGVSGETVRRWERGSHPIPEERLADLAQAGAALERLEGMFRPERLAQVVRRKAGLFGGEMALDWILRGRIGETAGRYETALAYQG
jgi:transcriptional regulator with XRE-family HTH domain